MSSRTLRTLSSACRAEAHEKYGACYACCERCNYDRHLCPFCGEELHHDSTDARGGRHWLSDCRPDLVEHAPGDDCTWAGRNGRLLGKLLVPDCYAYQDPRTGEWTDRHAHFYPDGPVT